MSVEATPRESMLAGHVRKLRSTLWEHLRRPSIESRARCFTLLDETQGEFPALPEVDPVFGLDGNTIEQCAGWCEDAADEKTTPEHGDPNDPIPDFVDAATLRWAAEQMRKELPDTPGPSMEVMRLFCLGARSAQDKGGAK